MTQARWATQVRRVPRRGISFEALIRRIAREHGVRAAAAWTKAVLAHRRGVSLERITRALRAGASSTELTKLLKSDALGRKVARAMEGPLRAVAQDAGLAGTRVLSAYGLAGTFDAVSPTVVRFAAEQAGDLVKDIEPVTRRAVAEVVARGAAGGLTVADQARAIRELVGLPPNWADAPRRFADELRAGRLSAATARRLSAVARQRIRKAIRTGSVTEAFIREMREEYTRGLINFRAQTIARTETLRASHHGLQEGWLQARRAGALPASARKYWIVTPDARLSPEHRRIPAMNPKGRALNEPFLTTEGLHQHPPSRPRCRCGVALGFGGRGPSRARTASRRGS